MTHCHQGLERIAAYRYATKRRVQTRLLYVRHFKFVNIGHHHHIQNYPVLSPSTRWPDSPHFFIKLLELLNAIFPTRGDFFQFLEQAAIFFRQLAAFFRPISLSRASTCFFQVTFGLPLFFSNYFKMQCLF